MGKKKTAINLLGQSAGGKGLAEAALRRRKYKIKKLASSKEAFTVKLISPKFRDPQFVYMTDQAAMEFVNLKASKGQYLQFEYKDKKYNIVKSFFTDVGELWARVINPDLC